MNVEKDFASKFDLDIKFSCYGYDVPENYGHVPSKEELINLINVDTSYINININDNLENSQQGKCKIKLVIE